MNRFCRASSTVVSPPAILQALRASTSAGFCSITVFAVAATKSLNSWLFAAKSVSMFTSRTQPTLPSTTAVQIPSAATLPLFFACVARPFSRRTSIAFYISPSVSTRAFLQSIMPTPVAVISSLISCTDTLPICISSNRFFVKTRQTNSQTYLPCKLSLIIQQSLPLLPRPSRSPHRLQRPRPVCPR